MVHIVAVLALFFGLFITSADAPADARGCDWQNSYQEALRSLGEQPGDWSMVSRNDAAGRVNPGALTAVVSTSVVCEYVPDVVMHEWAHLQQFRMHQTEHAARAHYGTADDLERVAACTARWLGARPETTVHINPESPSYVGACTARDYVEAFRLITFRA